MVCTSVRQSKRLLELGIDPGSNDMYVELEGLYEIHVGRNPKTAIKFVPLWTLGQLLNIIEQDFFYKLYHDGVMNVIEIKHHDDKTIYHVECDDDLIDSVYMVMCWILKNKKL